MNMHFSTSARPWISDAAVRKIFDRFVCTYRLGNGRKMRGTFVREQHSHEGALGFVFRCVQNGENWLWVIGKHNMKPFALCRVD